jgi:hypothetical protein
LKWTYSADVAALPLRDVRSQWEASGHEPTEVRCGWRRSMTTSVDFLF